ncbi:MAG: glycosyltransferase [Deltaproteobacteria bacterium]|nr:glycosyltransferase [Deltaproteobacteria bacterium]MBW1994181.1 glycosyltransferase [Deltaproteobacteria bacterium]MBW2154536.1 glycosyltransferase [Deltaproteobacteria bacterium]
MESICFSIAFMCGLFAVHRLFLIGIYLWFKHEEKHRLPPKSAGYRPFITIQLPVYNERYVVGRLIDAVCNIRYPRDLLEIQVLDDSDDITSALVDAMVEKKRSQGHPIRVIRRSSRKGYKAGALQNGLTSAFGEWILIFDSDFIPQPEILAHALPYLNDPALGMVQFCWDHINRDYSVLTRVQALFLDGHFHIEHFARNRSGRFFNFNGTAGMWRKKCIIESGGWEYDTLTEDMDLSYRAQMKGWKFLFLSHIRIPAELPIELSAFKSQQHRWAKGGIQTARKILPYLFLSNLPWSIKIEGAFHMLSNVMYLVLPLMILLMPFVLTHMSGSALYLYESVLLFSILSVIIFYIVAGGNCSSVSCSRILKDIPWLMAVGIGLCVNNSRAVLEGFFSNTAVFVRTPKYNVLAKNGLWKQNAYRIKRMSLFWVEVFFLTYLLTTLLYCIKTSTVHIFPFLVIFITGFFYFITLGLKQTVFNRA